jgi:hypothetical protein
MSWARNVTFLKNKNQESSSSLSKTLSNSDSRITQKEGAKMRWKGQGVGYL